MLHTDPSANSTPRRSDDGGFDEWLEFCRSRANSASNSATRFSTILILDNAAASNCVRSAMRWSRGSVSDPTQTAVHEPIAVSIPEPVNGYNFISGASRSTGRSSSWLPGFLIVVAVAYAGFVSR